MEGGEVLGWVEGRGNGVTLSSLGEWEWEWGEGWGWREGAKRRAFS